MKYLVLLLSLSLTQVNASGKQWLIFFAKNGFLDGKLVASPGHAFVGFYQENENLNQTTFSYWGFYPAQGKGVFGDVPGRVADDWLEKKSARDVQFFLEVSLEEFAVAERVRALWNTQRYSLTSNNCVDFVRDVVASVCRLEQPHGLYKTPASYILALKDANRDSEQQSENNLGNSSFQFVRSSTAQTSAPIPGANNSANNASAAGLPLSRTKIIWVSWAKVPQSIRSQFADFMAEYLESGCETKVAAVDLNGNGKVGYLIYNYAGSFCCGTGGCGLYASEEGKTLGFLVHEEQLDKVRLAKNGLLHVSGRFYPLK